MFAHLYKQSSKINKLGWVLIINDSARPIGGTEYQVSGKREARAMAKQYNAQPWNF